MLKVFELVIKEIEAAIEAEKAGTATEAQLILLKRLRSK